MKKIIVVLIGICLIFLPFLVLNADPSRTGYSGAPGSKGFCASSCHGTPGGTITLSGFPSTYSPGQTYTLKVSHGAGGVIANFNASVRIVTDNSNAGILSAGQGTATYNVAQETNGIHFSTASQDSGSFTWTAPDTAVGEVRLYLAGQQGLTSGDPNTELILSVNPGVCLAVRGDVTGDGKVVLADIVALINIVFRGAAAPNPTCRGDANADNKTQLTDIIYLINFLFRSGPAPIKSQECCL